MTIILAHDLKSPIRFAKTLASYAHRSIIAGKVDDNLQQATGDLVKASQQVYMFVEDFLLWMGTQRNDYHIHTELVDLESFADEIDNFFAEIVKLNGNTFLYSILSETPLVTDRHVLKIILRNIIDNANKNTNKGEIKLAISQTDGHHLFSISDTGSGMEEKKIRELVDKENNLFVGGGFGFKIVKDLIILIEGKLTIESKINVGTTVVISIPSQPGTNLKEK